VADAAAVGTASNRNLLVNGIMCDGKRVRTARMGVY